MIWLLRKLSRDSTTETVQESHKANEQQQSWQKATTTDAREEKESDVQSVQIILCNMSGFQQFITIFAKKQERMAHIQI